MKKSTLVSLLICALSPICAIAESVMRTSMEDAMSTAPIILLAESGKQEYDDLKEGETVKTDTMALECRKQHFKILKIYRNTSSTKLALNQDVQINAKSNSCLVYDVSVKKKGKELVVSYLGNTNNQPFTISTVHPPQKQALFLVPERDQLMHFGWFVSPKPFTQELEAKLEALPPPTKKTIQLNGNCN